jgi:hypothetical protein
MQKSTTFSSLGPVLSPLGIEEKNSKKVFWVFVPVQVAYFWTSKNFQKFFD